ncbi:MAG TPA: MBL fold metallo-hydrolase [Steroidobacteraceae bacterium]
MFVQVLQRGNGRSLLASGAIKHLAFTLAALSLALCRAGEVRANPFEYQWQQLSPAVWAGIRQDPFELPQEGNSVFVVGDRGVVVFDAGGSPAMGEAIVAKVRAVTDRPITHVFLSHWHGDHMRGLQAIRSAFPQVQIFAHPHAREFIVATQDRWLRRRETMVPNIRRAVADALSKQHDLAGEPLVAEEKQWLEKGLANTEQLDRENKRTAYVVPDATFTDRMTLHLGSEELQLLYVGRAHTAGDLVLWLPQERIVATGDIVTGPVPLMPSPYVRDYAGALNRIKALDFKTLVPGHGPIESGSQYVDLLIDTIDTVAAQMHAAVARGMPKEQAIASLDLAAIEARYTHGDVFLAHRFRDYVMSGSLAEAAYSMESNTDPQEVF